MAKEGKKALVPKLRFPEFRTRSGWGSTQLGDTSTQVTERVGERKLTPVSISAGVGFVPQAEKFGRDISGNQYSLYTLVRDGDFVYNKGNSLKFPQGCVYQLRGWGEVAAPNVFISFRLKQGYVAEYFQYCFEKNIHGVQLKQHITSGARSNGLLNVNKDQFYGIGIPMPLPDEQQKIAECLGSLDELIAAQGRKVEALKTYKRGLMQQLFPHEGETLPLLRFLNGGDWTEADLPEVAFFQEGPGIMAVDFCAEGVPLVRLAGVGGSVVTLNGCNYLDPEKVAHKWSHFRLAVNDLVISTSATFGLTSLVTDAAEGAVFYTGLIRFRPSTQSLDRGYLKAFLGSPCFERQVESAAVGGGIKHFGPSHIKRMTIPLPPLPEQQSIANCLDALDALITAETQKFEALKTQKTGLMQQLFPSLEEA